MSSDSLTRSAQEARPNRTFVMSKSATRLRRRFCSAVTLTATRYVSVSRACTYVDQPTRMQRVEHTVCASAARAWIEGTNRQMHMHCRGRC